VVLEVLEAPVLSDEEKKRDKRWSKWVVSRYGKCQNPWCTSPYYRLEAHHLISREDKRFRWTKKNGICFCYNCHRFIVHGVGEKAERQKARIYSFLSLDQRIKELKEEKLCL
jgi:hypothetical protein